MCTVFWLVSVSIVVAAIVVVTLLGSGLGARLLFFGLFLSCAFFGLLGVVVAAVAVAITFRRVGILRGRILLGSVCSRGGS